jgi:hypothetical protein
MRANIRWCVDSKVSDCGRLMADSGVLWLVLGTLRWQTYVRTPKCTQGSRKVPGIPLIEKVRQLIQYDRRMTIVEL